MKTKTNKQTILALVLCENLKINLKFIVRSGEEFKIVTFLGNGKGYNRYLKPQTDKNIN